MAKINVERKSKDIIKPSSPTPNHLKTLQLSFVDQFAPPFLIPTILFYQTPFRHNNISQTSTTILLKNSLSKTLVQFYPLAGRVVGNSSIDCNDEGVEFYEADVLTSLVEILANPDPEELISLLPYPPVSTNKTLVAAVQVNRFSCGSMAISASISHKIADGATIGTFFYAWANNTRGVSNNNHMKSVTFDSASFFPSMDLNGIFDPESIICKEKIVTRRLIFDKKKLDELRNKCDDGRLEKTPTRMELVSAFLWKKFIKTARAKPTPPKIFGVALVVNLKTIKGSPIPENYQGNLFWTSYTHTPIEPEIAYSEVVDKMRTALNKIDTSYLSKIKTGECLLELQDIGESLSRGEGEFFGVSSMVNFPFYEVDFGLGTPTWISLATMPCQNGVFLMPTNCGKGVEAWVNMLENYAATLEEDHEFRSLTTNRSSERKLKGKL